MPWENTWLAAPTRYAAIRQALKTAGVIVKDINVTLGGCAFWHAVISIKKQSGEAKNALLAALSVMDLKHVVVVDDDIDVHRSHADVEWAIATRVQGDRDVMIVANARAKPLDPSLPQGYRRGADRRQGRHRRHHPGRHPARALRAHHLCLRGSRQDRRLCERQGRRRRAKPATRPRWPPLALEILDLIAKDAALLHRHRGTVCGSTISTPSRGAHRPICTTPSGDGRTRAAACACAARNSAAKPK